MNRESELSISKKDRGRKGGWVRKEIKSDAFSFIHFIKLITKENTYSRSDFIIYIREDIHIGISSAAELD